MSNTSHDLIDRARTDFGVYCSLVHRRFHLARHIQFLIAKLTLVASGNIKRLMISMPPRHGKTKTSSELFPAWYLGQHPDRNVLVASYSQTLASDIGRRVLRNFSDSMHQAVFPEARMQRRQGSAEKFDLERGGAFYAVGREGTITGRGADLLLLDDLLKDQNEARSPNIRRQIIDFYERTALTRLSPEGVIILIGTRWGSNDLFDYLLEEQKQENWTVINLAALATDNDPLGRPEGDALWPEKFSAKHLRAKRLEMGALAFGCLYQGKPNETAGLIFKREWWQQWTVLPELKRIVLSIDSAFKTGKENNYSAIQVWGEAPTGFYLLHAWKDRVDYPTLKRKLLSFDEQWKPTYVLIEDAASGQSLIQDLRASTSLPIKAVKVDKDKETRAQACTGLLESGRVHVPASAPWLDSYLAELSGFPTGAHDDAVDSTTQALQFLRGSDSWMFHLAEMFSRPRPQKAVEQSAQSAPSPFAPPPGSFAGNGPCEPPQSQSPVSDSRFQRFRSFGADVPNKKPVPNEKSRTAPGPLCPECGKPLSRSGIPGNLFDQREHCGSCGFSRIVSGGRK